MALPVADKVQTNTGGAVTCRITKAPDLAASASSLVSRNNGLQKAKTRHNRNSLAGASAVKKSKFSGRPL